MIDIKIAVILVMAHLRHRPARMFLTLLSTIAAASVVVWVVSSYDSLVFKFDEFADNYLGRYEFVVLPTTQTATPDLVPEAPGAGHLSQALVAALKGDPAVAVIDPVFQTRVSVEKVRREATEKTPVAADRLTDGGRGPGFNRRPMLVGTDATEAPYRMLSGRWLGPQSIADKQAAISSESAAQMKVEVGDEVSVTQPNGSITMILKIIGIVEQRKALPSTPPIIGLPPMRGPPLTQDPASAALYVPLQLATQITGDEVQANYAGIILQRGVTLAEFKQSWNDRLAQASPPACLLSLQEVDAELENSTTSETVRAQAYSATGISLLAAVFIIFSTLSMGVDERIRQLAVLRAVTCTRAQIAVMIFMESLLLGLIGWACGLVAGWGLLKIASQSRPELFPVGSSLGLWCIVMSGLCSVGGALAAAVLPAWKASQVQPLEAMSPQSSASHPRIAWVTTILGLAFIAMNPLLVFWIPMPDQARYIMSAAIGCTCMGIGFILLAPATVILTEKLFAPLVAMCLLVNPRLLATQLTTNLWRSLGSTVALTLGLGLFIAMQTWGYSMLAPFTPGDWVPDFVAYVGAGGIPDDQVDAVRHLPGIIAERSLPCVSEQVKFATDVTGARIRATSSRQDNCVMIGIDPDLGLGGERPVFKFEFVSGSRDEALAKLKQGRYCLVPDHFERESGLTVGDKFGVVPPDAINQVVEYEIAGVVSMTGWHWMSKVGLRNRSGARSAGLMFAAFEQVREDFCIHRINGFWLNGDGSVGEDQVKASLEQIVVRNVDKPAMRTGRGGNGAGINIRSREGVRLAIRERADGIIWLLSRLPLVTLAVTSLGIINTIVSSIRARQWDLGIMRAVGLTRFGLFRLILCEAILVAIAACLLSFTFGLLAGYCGTGVTRYVNVRGGQIVPLVIPWLPIGIGFAMTLSLCLIAALWPAIRTGRVEPLRLLQAGRSAM